MPAIKYRVTLSEGRTLSVLVSPDSEFEISFSLAPDFNPEHTRTVVLNRHGDYAAWGSDRQPATVD